MTGACRDMRNGSPSRAAGVACLLSLMVPGHDSRTETSSLRLVGWKNYRSTHTQYAHDRRKIGNKFWKNRSMIPPAVLRKIFHVQDVL